MEIKRVSCAKWHDILIRMTFAKWNEVDMCSFMKSPWGPCSATCGVSVRSRRVQCRAFVEETMSVQDLPDSSCAGCHAKAKRNGDLSFLFQDNVDYFLSVVQNNSIKYYLYVKLIWLRPADLDLWPTGLVTCWRRNGILGPCGIYVRFEISASFISRARKRRSGGWTEACKAQRLIPIFGEA